jgi:hypothetical protein
VIISYIRRGGERPFHGGRKRSTGFLSCSEIGFLPQKGFTDCYSMAYIDSIEVNNKGG